MRNRFYAFALVPLLFVACNTPESSTPAPVVQSTKPITNIVGTQDVTNVIETQDVTDVVGIQDVTDIVGTQDVTTNVVETQPVETTDAESNTNTIKYVSKPIVIKQGMLHINGFMGTLKPTLKSAIEQDKSKVIAMGTCTSMAMQMTNDYNNISPNVKVRRTALKYRNPANKPDSTDKGVMYRLQAVNDGKPVAVDMGETYRVYKPLKTKQSCLYCHGDTTEISSKVQKILQTKYPHDLAVGFKLGEFRGVVVSEFQK